MIYIKFLKIFKPIFQYNRFTNKFKIENKEYRTLYKAFGLRFIINVSGDGGKFNIIPLLTKIGAGIGLLSVGSYIADFLLLRIHKKKSMYSLGRKGLIPPVSAANYDVINDVMWRHIIPDGALDMRLSLFHQSF